MELKSGFVLFGLERSKETPALFIFKFHEWNLWIVYSDVCPLSSLFITHNAIHFTWAGTCRRVIILIILKFLATPDQCNLHHIKQSNKF